MKHHDECMIKNSANTLRCSCVARNRGSRARDCRIEPRDVGALYERNIMDGDREYLAAVLDARTRRGQLLTAILDATTHKFRCLVRVDSRAPDGEPAFFFESGDDKLIVVAGERAMRPLKGGVS